MAKCRKTWRTCYSLTSYLDLISHVLFFSPRSVAVGDLGVDGGVLVLQENNEFNKITGGFEWFPPWTARIK